ncbi:MAG: alkaline phosphatase D family protein, partial [Candidatus Methylomirabilis sp.]
MTTGAQYLTPLRCGPLVRRVDRTSAVIWVELAEPFEVEVELEEARAIGAGRLEVARAWPVQVHGSYYAWVPFRFLAPGAWYAYRVFGRTGDGSRRKLWPDVRLSAVPLPSAFRTLPFTSLESLRLAFGSCRAGFPPGDPYGLREGPDALAALARRTFLDWEHREWRWPHLLLLTGDTIYADTISKQMEEAFKRPSLRGDGFKTATTFAQFAAIYREAWTSDPAVRWLLSCIPSLMIFDDHEVIDDWNISREWVRARRRSPRWVRRLADALLAYWLYQGAGNVAPREWRRDERMRLLSPRFALTAPDLTSRLTRLFQSYVRGFRRASWGFSLDAAGTRFVVGDTRMSRQLTGDRHLMDRPAWAEF